jgi:ADP-ribosyl-[dinitrogen reductase] hydrolase
MSAREIGREIGADAKVADALEAAASRPPADYLHRMGWVLIALQNAFWQLLHAPDLEEGVIRSVMAGGDTDTNAAIAGALLGAVHGRKAVPLQWMDRVLTCRPLAGLPGVRRPRPTSVWPVDALWLAERLLYLGQRAAAAP